MTTRYNPPHRVRQLNVPYRAAVLQNDPEHEAAKRKETLYEFSNGRKFRGDNRRLGPYSDVPNIR